MDPTLEEAARVSGASPMRTVFDVTLPLMAPSILAGGLLVFIAAGSCFGIPAIVGMPGNIEVMTTRIVTYIYMGDTAGVRDATALAASLMFLANILLFGMTWMVGKKDYTTISGKSTRPNIVELGKWKWPCFCLVGAYSMISIIIPLGSIVLTSLIITLSKPIALDNLGFDAGFLLSPAPSTWKAFGILLFTQLLLPASAHLFPSLLHILQLKPESKAAACRICW